MRIEQVESEQEKRVLTGMVLDRAVLARVANKWTGDEFNARWANLIGGWCVQYFRKYGEAPKLHVKDLFTGWAGKARDQDLVNSVERALVQLSEEYAGKGELNSQCVIDLAARHFTEVRCRRVAESVLGDLSVGKLDDAVERLQKFDRVEMGPGTAVDVLGDQEPLISAFEKEAEDILLYPGALGEFFRNQLTRDAFICFLAPEKRGKSFWLIDVAWRAVCQRRRTVLVSAGDMSERQMMRRLATRAAMHPSRSRHWPLTVNYPLKARYNSEGVLQVKTEEMVFEAPLDWRKAWKAFQETEQFRVKGKDFLRLLCYPNSTLSVRQLDAQVEQWAREGWVADVVVVDYADILDEDAAAPGGDRRDKINASWKQQRAFSQKHHLLYVTATQSDADSYTRDLLRRSNFSEDKRKLAHVTGMVGLNQTEAEKHLGAYRLNWLALREGEYFEDEVITTVGSLALANPCVKSFF